MAQIHLAKAMDAYERGMQAVDKSDLYHAIAAFEEALQVEPSYVDARIALGVALLQFGDLQRALTHLDEAVRLEPSHAIALGYLGMVYHLTGDNAQAMACWKQAIQAGPALPVELALALGQALTVTGLHDQARELLTRLVERSPTSPEARTMLGTTLFEMEDYAAARVEVEQALALDDSWAAAHHLRGLIALALDDLETARESFTRERELDTASARPAAMLAVTLQRLGQQDDAMAMVQAVLQHEILDIDARLTCAQVCANAAMYDTAIGMIQDLMDFAPDDEDAIDLLLEVATKAKDREALQWLREEIAEGDEELLQEIADCARAIGPAPKTRGKAKGATSRRTLPDTAYQLRIELTGLRPPIWRRVLVAGDTTLAELHQIIQAVMDWGDSHLHEFSVDGIRYADPRAQLEDTRDERKVTLARVAPREKDRINYLYDFGDNWELVITVMRIVPYDRTFSYPVCLTGKRAAPPEDCGGVWIYAELLEVLADPNHPEREAYAEWLAEYEAVNMEAIDLERAHMRLKPLQKRKGER
jgi:tetratricopeptide (TPR) repeat protein